MSTPTGDAGAGAVTDQQGDATGSTEGQQPGNQETGEGTGGPGPVDWQAEAEKWKGLARKHEGRAKENSAAAKRLQDLEDANKSELQRAQERAAKAEADTAAEKAERHRLLAAASNGLGPDFIGYLGGGSEDEINERATTLKNAIETAVAAQVRDQLSRYGISVQGQNGTAPTATAAASLKLGNRPVETLRPGSLPSGDKTPKNNNDVFRGMLGKQ